MVYNPHLTTSDNSSIGISYEAKMHIDFCKGRSSAPPYPPSSGCSIVICFLSVKCPVLAIKMGNPWFGFAPWAALKYDASYGWKVGRIRSMLWGRSGRDFVWHRLGMCTCLNTHSALSVKALQRAQTVNGRAISTIKSMQRSNTAVKLVKYYSIGLSTFEMAYSDLSSFSFTTTYYFPQRFMTVRS